MKPLKIKVGIFLLIAYSNNALHSSVGKHTTAAPRNLPRTNSIKNGYEIPKHEQQIRSSNSENMAAHETSFNRYQDPRISEKSSSLLNETDLSQEEIDALDAQVDLLQNQQSKSPKIDLNTNEIENLEKNELQNNPENLQPEHPATLMKSPTKAAEIDIPQKQAPTPQESVINKQETFTSQVTTYINHPELITLAHQNTTINNAPAIKINYTGSPANPIEIPIITPNEGSKSQDKSYKLTQGIMNKAWTSPLIQTNEQGAHGRYSFEVSYTPAKKARFFGSDTPAQLVINEYSGTQKIQSTTYSNKGELLNSTTYPADGLPVTAKYTGEGNLAYQPASLSKAILNKGITSGITSYLTHPKTQNQIINALISPENIKYAIDYINSIELSASSKSALSPEQQESLNMLKQALQIKLIEFGNQGLKHVISSAQNSLESISKNDPSKTALQQEQSSLISQENLTSLQKLGSDAAQAAKSRGVEALHSALEQQFGKPKDPAEIEKENTIKENLGKKLTEEALLQAPQEKAKAAEAPEKAPTATTMGMKDYLFSAFKKSAQALGKSPKNVRAFVKNIAQTISSFMKLTEEEVIKLDSLVEQESKNLIQDKNSFIYADPRSFNLKFTTWIQSFANKCSALVGKKNITNNKILLIQTAADPLAPTLSIATKTLPNGTKQAQSAFVTYNKSTYSIDPQLVQFSPDGSISINKIPLYENITPQTLYENANNSFYNARIKNSLFNPFKTSSAGKTAETIGGKEFIASAENAMLAGQNSPTKLLSISYKSDKSAIMQEINLATKITTQKSYASNGKLLQQQASIPTDPANIFMPDIKLSYTPKENPEQAIDLKITHTNPMTGTESNFNSRKIEYIADKGIYRIESLYKAPESDAVIIKDQIMKQLIDKNIIKKDDINAQQAEEILDTIIPIFLQFPDKAYNYPIDNFSAILNASGFSAATFNKFVQGTVPQEALSALKKYLQDPAPTSIQAVVVEYNPATQEIAHRVVTRMSYGNPVAFPATKPVDQ